MSLRADLPWSPGTPPQLAVITVVDPEPVVTVSPTDVASPALLMVATVVSDDDHATKFVRMSGSVRPAYVPLATNGCVTPIPATVGRRPNIGQTAL